MMSEWIIQITCERCGRNANKYYRGKWKDKRAVGCKECGTNFVVELREQTTKVGPLKVDLYVPYYGD